MTDVDELRLPTAGRLLTIRREARDADCDPMECAAVCNARVLAESCYLDGECVFASGQAVLEALTFREMETLLRKLSGTAASPDANPRFDESRFHALREG